jgi:hypothetical protein
MNTIDKTTKIISKEKKQKYKINPIEKEKHARKEKMNN